METAPQPELAYDPQQKPQNPQNQQNQQNPQAQQQPVQQEQYAKTVPGEWAEEQQLAEGPGTHDSPWFAAQVPDGAYEGSYNPMYVEGLEPTPVMIPSGPGGRTRPLGNVGTIGAVPGQRTEQMPMAPEAEEAPEPEPDQGPVQGQGPVQERFPVQEQQPKAVVEAADEWAEEWAQEDAEFSEIAYEVFAAFVTQHSTYPSIEVLDIHLSDGHNVRHPRSAALLRQLIQGFKNRYHAELEADHIA